MVSYESVNEAYESGALARASVVRYIDCDE